MSNSFNKYTLDYPNLDETDKRFFDTSNILFKIKSKNEDEPDIKLVANINHFLNRNSKKYYTIGGEVRQSPNYYITCNYNNFHRFMNNIRVVQDGCQNTFTIKSGGVYNMVDAKYMTGFIYPTYIESYKEQLEKMMNLWIEPVSEQIKNKCQQPNHITNIRMTQNQLLMYSKCISKENMLFGKLSDVKSDEFLLTTGYISPEFPSLDCNLDNFTAICSQRGTGKPLVALALSKQKTLLSKLADIDINIIVVEKGIMHKWKKYLKAYYQEDYLIINNKLDFEKFIYNIPEKGDDYYLKYKHSNFVLINFIDIYHKYLFGGIDTPDKRKTFLKTCKKNIHLKTSIERLGINISDTFDYLDNQGDLQIQELKKYSVVLADPKTYTKLAMYLALNDIKITRLFIDCIDNSSDWKLYNIPIVKAVKHYRILSNMRTFLYADGNECYYPDEKGHPMKSIKAPSVNNYAQTKPFHYISNAIQQYITHDIDTTKCSYQLKALQKFAENIFVFTYPEYNFKIDTYLVPCIDNKNNRDNIQIHDDVIKCINEGQIDNAIEIMKLQSNTLNNIEEKCTRWYNITITTKKTEISRLQNRNTDNDVDNDVNNDVNNDVDNDVGKIAKLNKEIIDTENSKMDLSRRLHMTECMICMNDIKNSVVLGCCKNVICFECIITSLINRPHCPVCRTNMNVDTDLTLVSTENTDLYLTFDTFDKIMARPTIKIDMLSRILKYIKHTNKLNGISNKIIIDLGIYTGVDYRHIKSYMDDINIPDVGTVAMDNELRYECHFDYLNDYISSDLVEILIIHSNTPMTWQNMPNTTDIIKIGYMNDFVEKCIMGAVGGIDRQTPLRVWQLENMK